MEKIKYLIILFLIIFLTGCGFIKHIEDTNGSDDYTLQTFITDEDLLGNTNTISVGSVTQNKTVNNISQGTFKVKKLSGKKEIVSV